MRNHAYKKAYKKFLLKLRSQIFSCVFSRSFIVSGCFAFSSVIHFELIFFAYSVKYGLNFLFFFLSLDIHLFQHYLVQKTCPLPTKLPLHLCGKSVGYICMGLFLDSSVPLTCNVQRFQFLHILIKSCYYLYFFFLNIAILISVKSYPIVVLICISLKLMMLASG